MEDLILVALVRPVITRHARPVGQQIHGRRTGGGMLRVAVGAIR